MLPNHAADAEECNNDPRKLERQEDVALMVLGEDADQLGGVRCDKTFLGLSDVRACGKMLVLEKLLTLWSQPGANNKVRHPSTAPSSSYLQLHIAPSLDLFPSPG